MPFDTDASQTVLADVDQLLRDKFRELGLPDTPFVLAAISPDDQLVLRGNLTPDGLKHTWPGPKLWRAMLRGEEIPRESWRPLKSVTKSWKQTIKAAEVDYPHRFHDIRARAITEVAKVMPAAAQGAACHQDPATTSLYIGLASTEIADAVEQAVAKRPNKIKLKVIK